MSNTNSPSQETLLATLESYLEWLDTVAMERTRHIDEILADAQNELGILSADLEQAQSGLVDAQIQALKKV